MPVLLVQAVDFTSLFPGLTELGYTLHDPDGDVVQARQLIDVVEDGVGSGYYTAELSFPVGFEGTILWDIPGTAWTARDTIDLSPEGPAGAGGGQPAEGNDDLLSAALTAAHAGLAEFFDETDPEWHSKFFRGPSIGGPDPPYAEFLVIDGPSAGYDSGRSYSSTPELQMSIFSDTRGQAVNLGLTSADFFSSANLQWQGGGTAAIFLANPGQGAERDPERWRDGKRLWSKVLRFRVLAGGSV